MKKIIKIGIIVMLFLVAALMTSSTTWYSYNENIKVGFDKIKDCWAKTDIELNYTCETDYFNYTTNPVIVSCYEGRYLTNISDWNYDLIFKHKADRWDISTKTFWWNVTQTPAGCENTGNVNVYLNKSDKIFHWVCDYSAWGECKIDKQNRRIVCDSKMDGNKDGVCNSGESCLTINITKEGLKRVKNTGFSEVMGRFDIDCEIQ